MLFFFFFHFLERSDSHHLGCHFVDIFCVISEYVYVGLDSAFALHVLVLVCSLPCQHGWLPMLSGVPGASPGAASASESASYLMIGSGLPPWSRINPMSGLMVALSLIRSLVFLLLELGSLLTSQ